MARPRRNLRRGALLAALSACAAAWPEPARAEPPPLGQRCARATARMAELLRRGLAVDAHLVGQVLDGLCAGAGPPRWRLLDAAALVRLEEPARAAAVLARIREGSALSGEAAVLRAWALWRGGDAEGFRSALADAAPSARPRLLALDAVGSERFRGAAAELDAGLRARVLKLHRRYEARPRKRPWLAGGLSAILPGAGQLYAGSLEGAAVAFALNGALIGSTVELAREELYFSAAAAGVAASIFYVGNVLNAADLAGRYNERAAAPLRAPLERALVPEAYP